MRSGSTPLLVVGLVLLGLLVAGGTAVATYQLVVDQEAGDRRPDATSTPTRTTDSTPAPGGGWREVARRYAVAFTDTRGGHDAWVERLEPLVGPSLAQGYGYTDLAVVPDQRFVRLTGGQETPGDTPARAVTLHYDAGLRIDATVSQDPETGRWVVTTAVPQEDR